jgi:hypothetical protein
LGVRLASCLGNVGIDIIVVNVNIRTHKTPGFQPGFNPDLYTQFSAGTSDSPATIIDYPEKHRSAGEQNTGWKPMLQPLRLRGGSAIGLLGSNRYLDLKPLADVIAAASPGLRPVSAPAFSSSSPEKAAVARWATYV